MQTKRKMLKECKDYLEIQMNNENSVVSRNRLFSDIKIMKRTKKFRKNLLTWESRGEIWNITYDGDNTAPLINVRIEPPVNWNSMFLSHVQHMTVVMGLITNWMDKNGGK